jgi:hypothetical protein
MAYFGRLLPAAAELCFYLIIPIDHIDRQQKRKYRGPGIEIAT